MKFFVEKQPASAAIEKLIRAACKLPGVAHLDLISIVTNAGHQHGHYQQRTDVNRIEGALKAIQPAMEWLNKSQIAKLASATVQVSFANPQGSISLILTRTALFDEVMLQPQFQNAGAETVKKVAALLDELAKEYSQVEEAQVHAAQTALQSMAPKELLAQLTGRLTDTAVDLRFATKEALETFTKYLTESSQKLTTDIAREYEKIRAQAASERAALEKELAAQKAQIEQERANNLQQLEAERNALQKEREAFLEEKKKFDDNNNRHMRRAESSKILEKLDAQKEIKLSDATNQKVLPIQVVCGALAAAAAGGAGYCAWVILHKDIISWYHMIPFSASLLVLVSTALYYLRWQSAWLSRHADLETRNQLLRVDVLRASWFAELLFEFKDEKQATVPESVIQAMTKNLFELKANPEVPKHPVDDVAGFLSRMNRVRLTPSEVEMESDAKARARK